jgi:hypothetical protein
MYNGRGVAYLHHCPWRQLWAVTMLRCCGPETSRSSPAHQIGGLPQRGSYNTEKKGLVRVFTKLISLPKKAMAELVHVRLIRKG